MRVKSFAEIKAEFYSRVARDLCCNLATIDAQGRPRSRAVHPLWEALTAWVLTSGSSPKVSHIDHRPFASLAYIGDVTKTAFAECQVEKVEDLAEKQRIWELFKQSPLGYDPSGFYVSATHPDLVVLKLVPWRIQIDDTPGETYVWVRE